ncbi:hypothetical protein [Streptomyces sp. MBT53]|uniref:hypothetical protein n=1 Tax=Streptomyces sp. MBT53 TaxID=1488384 RepID=UPI0019115BB4|nr:hypothetical protein [Streptomyces sp. MBT53]MBK6015333.1 hypothetical protein [Streptomyces sp. MBT53]
MNRPLPHQLIQVLPVQTLPPPLMPVVRPPEPPPAAPEPQTPPTRRRRRFRTPRALRDDAFWSGALTALCIGGLLMAILATA